MLHEQELERVQRRVLGPLHLHPVIDFQKGADRLNWPMPDRGS